ncbi:MAG: phosphatase PAP2 family protein [bacterium]
MFEFLRRMRELPVLVIIAGELVGGLLLSFWSLFIFGWFAREVLERELLDTDAKIAGFVYDLRSPLMTQVMFFITSLGLGFIFFIVFVLFLYLVWKIHHRKRELILFIFVVGMGGIINVILKYFIKIPRPNDAPLVQEFFYSFPSGHAMNAFVFYGIVAYFVFAVTKQVCWRIGSIFLAVIMIFLVGFSRVYLGVHHPSDILGGYIAGFWWLMTVIVMDKTFEFYSLVKIMRLGKLSPLQVQGKEGISASVVQRSRIQKAKVSRKGESFSAVIAGGKDDNKGKVKAVVLTQKGKKVSQAKNTGKTVVAISSKLKPKLPLSKSGEKENKLLQKKKKA